MSRSPTAVVGALAALAVTLPIAMGAMPAGAAAGTPPTTGGSTARLAGAPQWLPVRDLGRGFDPSVAVGPDGTAMVVSSVAAGLQTAVRAPGSRWQRASLVTGSSR